MRRLQCGVIGQEGRRGSKPMIQRFVTRVVLVLMSLLLVSHGQEAGAQDALRQIRARGEIIIATDATYPPFEYKDKDKLVGFDVDLGNEIGKRLGVKVT